MIEVLKNITEIGLISSQTEESLIFILVTFSYKYVESEDEFWRYRTQICISVSKMKMNLHFETSQAKWVLYKSCF